MLNNNLMHINSRNIGTMDSLSEYQKLYINNLIGEKLNKGFAKVNFLTENWPTILKTFDPPVN